MKAVAIKIDASSNVPKYLQIVDNVKVLIKEKELKVGNPLPSIRQICLTNNLSQETVLKAYNELKENGIIKARERQGYFVQTDKVEHDKNIFLLFDELSEYKKILYNTIREGLNQGGASTKIFFHHCDIEVFESLIMNNMNSYNMFVVMPFSNDRIPTILEKLKGKDILLLDRRENLDQSKFSYIVQDFNLTLFDCLKSALQQIRKYKEFILVFPDTDSIASNAYKAPKDIKTAFGNFCTEFDISSQVIPKVEDVRSGQAYFFIDDVDMVTAIEMAKDKGLELGNNIGIISYNDFPLKRVIANGITVISTDFEKMGEELVSFVLGDSPSVKSIVGTKLLLRNSL